MTIGKRIKQSRETAGLTQPQLAKAIGIRASGRQRVCDWEADRRTPRLNTLVRIADATGTTAAFLMFGDEDK